MTLYIWRHPKPLAAVGICLGHTDMAVDRRKLKRLANQIVRYTRRHHLPKVIWVSPLQRSLKVGQLLAERGFHYHVSPELTEIDFGDWDGRPWTQIAKDDIDEWCADFAHFAPDNGENLYQLFTRVEGWLTARNVEQIAIDKNASVLAVGHGGWITAAKRIIAGEGIPKLAAEWSNSVAYNELSLIESSKKDKN